MSGVYIPNTKIPTTCMKCFCLDPQWARCQILGKGFSEDEDPMKSRPKWCPLINVQEHGRLVDIEPLMRGLYEEMCMEGEIYTTKQVYEMLDQELREMPTIIPAESEGE